MDIKKGQKVWVWQYKDVLTETIVKKIGRKYISLDYPSNIKFNINNLREHNFSGISAYIILDIEEYKRNNIV